MAKESAVAYPWRDFMLHMRENWSQGEHWALVAPTGEGKTTFVSQLVMLRRWVGLYDQKGGTDDIVAILEEQGWPRVNRWPLSMEMRKKIREGKEPVRLIVGGKGRKPQDKLRRRAYHQKTLDGMSQEGGWTILIPDLALLTDRRFGNAGDKVTEGLLEGRSAKNTYITEFQRPAGVPREAADQATYLATSYTRDTDTIARLAEMMGRSRVETRGAVKALGDDDGKFAWIVVSRNPREPLMVVRPPKLA
jgi:hypothetical protein